MRFLIFLLAAVFFFVKPASAKRVLYPTPILTASSEGGYNTAVTPKLYCRNGFPLKEAMQKSPFIWDARINGIWVAFVLNLRNLSTIPQNVTIFFDSVTFENCAYGNSEISLTPDCFTKFYNNGGAGYSAKLTIPANSLYTTRWQIGCMGHSGRNNCWLTMLESNDGTATVATLQMIFGVPSLMNVAEGAALATNLCYTMSSVVSTRIEVAEDKGALSGSVTVDYKAPNSGSSFQLNGGRPF